MYIAQDNTLPERSVKEPDGRLEDAVPNKLKEKIPDPELLLSLEPEELARSLLEVLNNRTGPLSQHSFINSLHQSVEIFPHEFVDKIAIAIAEAWGWLITQGLLVAEPMQAGGDRVIVTRRGKQIAAKGDFDAFRKASRLPREILHPTISEKAWPNFIRGDYDTAVFQAFKEVEVKVRDAGGFDHRKIGVSLMREAFHKERGPLTDDSLPEAEREALAALFAGAIGSYKNPSSHRTVTIEEPLEAGEMLILASHLLRIVEDREMKR